MHIRMSLISGVVMAAALLSACAHAKSEVAAKTEAPASQPAVTAPAPEPAPAATPPAVQPESPSFQDAYFDFDQSLIRSDAKQPLERDAEILKSHPELKVTVGGYCDERGTDEYNLALGNRRAVAVKRYLVALGVAPERMKTISYGKEQPFCTEHTESCYQENRRGHFLASAAGM